MVAIESSSDLSHRNYWPWPIRDEDPKIAARVYRKAVEVFLEPEFIEVSPLTDSALLLVEQYMPNLLKERRWKNFQVEEMGDMNCGTHDLRQAGITAQALWFDAEPLAISNFERDLTIAGAVLHDLGELATGDITYDKKQLARKEQDLAESQAVMSMIDASNRICQQTKNQLKEIYLRITTSLDEETMIGLLEGNTCFDQAINWGLLRRQFQLYERYGYLQTAFQQYPLRLETEQLSPEDLTLVQEGDRPELEQALNTREVSPEARLLILFKNVITNQWGHIEQAASEVPSVNRLFINQLVAKVLPHANKLMGLEIESLLSQV